MEMRNNMSFGMSNIKREYDPNNDMSDIRNIKPQPGEFERELMNNMTFAEGPMAEELRNNYMMESSRNFGHSNINDDVIRLADRFLNEDNNYPVMNMEDAPFMNDNPFMND